MLLAAFTAQLVMRRQPSTPNWMVAISLRLALPLASGNVDQPAHADPGEAPARAEEAGGAERETGPFGPIYTQFHHDAQGAIEYLREQQTGEATAALHHPEVGDIDLVWGEEGTAAKDYEDGFDLAKITKKHHDVLGKLQAFVESLPVKSRSSNRIVLSDGEGRAVVRLDWDGKAKKWLMTALKEEPTSDRTRTGAAVKTAEARSRQEVGNEEATTSIKPEREDVAQPSSEITDFGEKLEGNRKDLPPSLKDELSDDQIATQPLSKSWPADAHEAIEDATAAALTFAARQEVTAKPRVAHKLRAWVAQVKMLRDMVRDPDDAQRFIAQGEAVKNVRGLEHFFTKVRLLTQIPREHWKRIGKVAEYPNARRAKPKSEMESLGWRYVYAGAPGKAGEIAKATGVYAGYVRQNEDGTWRGMTKAEEQSQWVRP